MTLRRETVAPSKSVAPTVLYVWIAFAAFVAGIMIGEVQDRALRRHLPLTPAVATSGDVYVPPTATEWTVPDGPPFLKYVRCGEGARVCLPFGGCSTEPLHACVVDAAEDVALMTWDSIGSHVRRPTHYADEWWSTTCSWRDDPADQGGCSFRGLVDWR